MELQTLLFLVTVLAVVLFALKERRAVAARSAKPGPARPELSARELAATLRRGGLPAAMPVGFRMRADETCVGVVDADVEQWLQGDGTYISKHVGWAGGLGGLVLGSAIAAAGNARRRAEASREAEERWRLVGTYRIYFTTERIAMEGGTREWHEFWLDDIRQVSTDGTAVIIQTTGGAPATRVHATPSAYWHMLLRRLVFDERPHANA